MSKGKKIRVNFDVLREVYGRKTFGVKVSIQRGDRQPIIGSIFDLPSAKVAESVRDLARQCIAEKISLTLTERGRGDRESILIVSFPEIVNDAGEKEISFAAFDDFRLASKVGNFLKHVSHFGRD